MILPLNEDIKSPDEIASEIEGLVWPRDRERIEQIQTLLNMHSEGLPATGRHSPWPSERIEIDNSLSLKKGVLIS